MIEMASFTPNSIVCYKLEQWIPDMWTRSYAFPQLPTTNSGINIHQVIELVIRYFSKCSVTEKHRLMLKSRIMYSSQE